MATKTGFFTKLASAAATGGGNNIRDGIYKKLIEKVFVHEGHNGDCFIAEFRVVESEANGAVDDRGVPVIPNAVGSNCSMVCNFSAHESAAGNAKAFVEAAIQGLGYSYDEFVALRDDKGNPMFASEEEALAFCCSDQNPLRGIAIANETRQTVNKGRKNPANAGKKLTLNGWRPIAQTEEDIAEQRKFLDRHVAKADAAPKQAAPATPVVAPPAPVTASSPSVLKGILMRKS